MHLRFTRFDQWLDQDYLPDLADKDPAIVRRDFQAFRRYYFAYNEDPVREKAIRDRMGN